MHDAFDHARHNLADTPTHEWIEHYILQFEAKVNFVDRDTPSEHYYTRNESLAPIPTFNMNIGSVGLLNARYI